MNLLTEGIIIAIIAAAAGALSGWWQSRGNREHLRAQAAEEREQLEQRFEARINRLVTDKGKLERLVEILKTELQELKAEKDQWQLERHQWDLERKTMARERESWTQEKQALENKIVLLEEDIRKIKKKTGNLY